MVFETLVANLLNKYLGEFVVNLDKSQLNIGIWGGDVELENLQLRDGALDKFNLPIRVHKGFLHKLVLKVPWKNLYSQAATATIDGLYILAGPRTGNEYSSLAITIFSLLFKIPKFLYTTPIFLSR
ncbi:uncharacterized protein TRIADDRAFT_21612 [Trichoplax adhaerens]|uniref:Chorein N-terminal domain-containing protein n=1 Tax=Trichoplax adhaerens TaxID=10228 RepID=B3RNS2_TRIAD|nr:hypothetical protein TRIADDRAFT_21612 [Trichoplax adhaerens]EDV27511.1 hypothetical protein TRIADDRAFT_21612 [Trichoplax adhaerens]|eukprot:XP_002109345.1 hypothetical protein TRIADDRAFT_21612 [Trichoplax adhaerens]